MRGGDALVYAPSKGDHKGEVPRAEFACQQIVCAGS
jgi:hypothetical protein